nr:MAG TPA: hypothetical protein [Caudoviricetes sp.]
MNGAEMPLLSVCHPPGCGIVYLKKVRRGRAFA